MNIAHMAATRHGGTKVCLFQPFWLAFQDRALLKKNSSLGNSS